MHLSCPINKLAPIILFPQLETHVFPIQFVLSVEFRFLDQLFFHQLPCMTFVTVIQSRVEQIFRSKHERVWEG